MAAGLGIIGKETFVKFKSYVGGEPSEVPKEYVQRLNELVQRYPSKKSAVMPALYLAQEHFGWISYEAIKWVSSQLDLPPAHVESVATFYTMYYKRPVGQYHVQVCRTLSCMLCGAKDISKYLAKRFSVSANVVTSDGFWSWEEVECLGSCGSAPMVQINDVFFEFLNDEKLETILIDIEKNKPDLRYHTTNGDLGKGLPDRPRSQVLGQR